MYAIRSYYEFQAQFPEPDAKAVFETAIQRLIGLCQRILAILDNGSLQRYLFLMLLFTAVLTAAPMMAMNQTVGSRVQLPIT